MASSHWYVGPWRWVATEDSQAYEGPEGTRVAIDFRGLPEQGQAGNDMSGLGLFYCPDAESVASEWEPLGQGSWHDIKANGRMRNLFPKRRGVKLDADDLIGLIRQTLMAGDPTGQEFCKPLLPTMVGTLEVTCGRRRHSERFKWGGKETNAIRDIIRNDMEDVIERAGKGKNKKQREHHRRVLDALCEKHGIEDWKEFVKPERVKDIPGRLKHETTITDDFNRADGAIGSSSEGWSWTNVAGTATVSSNRWTAETADGLRFFGYPARAESDLSSADHYAEGTVYPTASGGGAACVRFNSAANTYYAAGGRASNGEIIKRVAGTITVIAGSTFAVTSGTVVRVIVNGSTVDFWRNGVSATSVTDTSITGNLRTGLAGKLSAQIDNFSASDGMVGGILNRLLHTSRNSG